MTDWFLDQKLTMLIKIIFKIIIISLKKVFVNRKTNINISRLGRYNKVWGISIGTLIKHKPLISEDLQIYYKVELNIGIFEKEVPIHVKQIIQ